MKALQKELFELTMDLQNAPMQRRTIQQEDTQSYASNPAAWFRADPDIWMPAPTNRDPDVWGPPPVTPNDGRYYLLFFT